MGRKEKARGNRLERVVAKALSSGLGLPFVRTPNSGAWGKAHTNGDVVCLADEPSWKFPFTIECKKTKRVQLELLLTDRIWAKFEEWWAQAEAAAEEEGKQPMLVMSHNQGPLIAVFRDEDWTDFPVNGMFLYRPMDRVALQPGDPKRNWHFTILSEFIRVFEVSIPDDIKERYAEEALKYT